MEDSIKKLGLCILASSILICGTWFYIEYSVNRYEAISQKSVFDKRTGIIYFGRNGNIVGKISK